MRHIESLGNGGRIFVSAILAFLVLTLLSFFYCKTPVSKETPGESTDYKWYPNSFYCRGTEGFAWGKTNNEGYLNPFDYDEEMPLDILVMGSSHMEGYQVRLTESTTAQLNAISGRNSAYNIGMVSHFFLTCVGNLEAALRKYRPARCVVMEVHNLSFSDEDLRRAIDGTTPEIYPHLPGILDMLRNSPFYAQNPYLRRVREQIKFYHLNSSKKKAPAEEISASPGLNNERLLDALLAKISRTVGDADTNAVIFYHPPVSVNADGGIFFPDNPELSEQFARCCENHGIRFLDMRERFRREYENGYILPYGFFNTAVGVGHLNKYGHAMIAQELYRVIWEER